MKRFLLLAAFSFSNLAIWAQSTLSGTVTDDKGKPVKGASVYLDNTIDGTTTDSAGHFTFSTSEAGAQTLVASEVSHENAGIPVTVKGDLTGLTIKMKSTAHSLDDVTITAGSFEASDKNKTILTPLDVVTTAGSQADVVRAIQTLPGTQAQGAQTGLFVRGGDASEAAVVVDGMVAQNAFLSTAPGVAARSRFGPFQFKGVAFSSGGYSARYGQALSSVLELNTNDLPDKSTINLGINMAGVYASGSKLFKKTSVDASAYYNNLTPFYGIAKTNVDYYDVPKGGGGSAKYTWAPNKNGLLKAGVNYSQFRSGTRVPSPSDATQVLDFGIKSQNVYSSLSYKQTFKDKWMLFTSAAYSYNQDDVKWDTIAAPSKDDRTQVRAEVKNYTTSRLSILLGGEMQHFHYDRTFSVWNTNFTETQIAGYAEADWNAMHWLALKPGVRYEHSILLNSDVIMPRLALGIKSGLHGQFSLAGGMFYQTVDQQYLLAGYRPQMQQAVHYIANYQYMHKDRTLRIEGYYKSYDQLVRQFTAYSPNNFATPYGYVDNTGYGYATGAELFWRDKKTIKNADYWISYSFIDTKRLFKNYPTEAQPDFIASHTLNVVTKYFIEKWSTQINVTYNFATGRPYYNPSKPASEFFTDRTPDYNNLSLTVNYLHSIGKWFTVVYAGIDNITNAQNIFGYRYDAFGNKYPVRPALYRSVFVGVNFSLTAFDKDEL
ncbi:MAG: TonB-dependent receptor [Bacteroidetes bacterium]|nr:TonB-dependent receptor [Bacteroidota bacterium]